MQNEPWDENNVSEQQEQTNIPSIQTEQPTHTHKLEQSHVGTVSRHSGRGPFQPFLVAGLAFGIVGSMFMYFSFAATPPSSNQEDSPNAIAANQVEIQAKRETMQLVSLAKKLQANPSDQSLIKQVVDSASQRKADMQALIAVHPDIANQIHIPAGIKKNLPDAAKASVEDEVELTGTLTVIHGEHYDQKKNELNSPFYSFELTDRTGAKNKLHASNQEAIVGLAGATIKVRGIKLAADTAVDPAAGAPTTITAAAVTPATQKKTAVLLVNYSDNTTQPWTADQVKATVFGSTAPSDTTYYQEQSFNQVGLSGKLAATGDVFGWYTVSDTAASCPMGGDYGGWGSTVATHANAAASAAGVDLTGYNNFIYVTPSTACSGYAGWAYINGSQAWITGYGTNARVIAHELGHNFGTHHAASESCTDTAGVRVSISATCTISEYGDPFDVMGNVFNHMNAYHKVQAGYIPSTSVPTITASGTYTLAPLENASTSVQSIRIPAGYLPGTSTPAYYYLEYRQPSGYDNFTAGSPVTQGVLIHQATDYTNRIQSRLIDTTPSTTSFNDAALAAGGTFTDVANSVSVKTESVSATGATVSLILGAVKTCVHANPTVTASPTSQFGTAGQALSYTLTVKNNDSAACGNSTFGAALGGVKGFTQSAGQVSVSPGTAGTITVTITSDVATPAGYYTLTESISNVTVAGYGIDLGINYNVTGGDTTAPAVTIKSPLSGATVSKKTSISATSTDNIAVASMEIWIDGVQKATVSGPSISYTWSITGKVPRGSHTILVKAYDSSGNLGQQQISVTI